MISVKANNITAEVEVDGEDVGVLAIEGVVAVRAIYDRLLDNNPAAAIEFRDFLAGLVKSGLMFSSGLRGEKG